MKKYFAMFILLTAIAAHAQPSPYSNALFNPVTMTATGQTSAPLKMAQFSAAGGGFNLGTITVKATSLTTVTFGILGSADNGITFSPLNIWNVLTPSTVATTATATAAGLYQFSLAGMTHIEFVTSGTFTATGLSLVLTATPAPAVTKNGGSSGAPIVTSSVTNAGPLVVGTTTANSLIFETNGSTRWTIGTAPGNLIPNSNNGPALGDATHQILAVYTTNSISVIGAPVASAATIATTGSIFHITGTVTVSTITPPTGFDSTHGGTITFIADGIFLTATGGNIANVITTTAGSRWTATWDGSLWYIAA